MSEATYEGKMPTIDDFCDPEPIEQKEMFPGFPYFLFTPEEFNSVNSSDLLKCKCRCCHKEFVRSKGELKKRIKRNITNVYCSLSCASKINAKIQNANRNIVDTKSAYYICELCGKKVLLKDSYGSHRFCSSICARSFATRNMSKADQAQKMKQWKEKFYLQKERNLAKQCFSLIKENSIITNVININQIFNENPLDFILDVIRNMQCIWTLSDIQYILKIDQQYFKSIIKKYNLVDSQNFINPSAHKAIEFYHTILQKSIIDGSITLDDKNEARNIIERHLNEDNLTLSEIGILYGHKNSPHNFLQSLFAFKFEKPNSKKDICVEKVNYYKACEFHFSKYLYPYLPGYEITQKYGIFSFRKNDTNRLLSATRDHMISRNYGWINKIDPYLISHPANCYILSFKENNNKRTQCSLTLTELIERVEWFNNTILFHSETDIFHNVEILCKYNPNIQFILKCNSNKFRHLCSC